MAIDTVSTACLCFQIHAQEQAKLLAILWMVWPGKVPFWNIDHRHIGQLGGCNYNGNGLSGLLQSLQ